MKNFIKEIEQLFETENQFSDRYIIVEKYYSFLQNHYSDIVEEIGKSTLGIPIYKLSIGSGNKKVLMWGQMHGNETTAPLAILDFLKFIQDNKESSMVQNIVESYAIDIIPILNPDGARAWARENAVGIDLNRDFLKAESNEMKILQKVLGKKKYDVAFNLHDQVSMYGVEGTKEGTMLAFMAPPVSEEREVTPARKVSMELIASIYAGVSQLIPNRIARYTDDYGARCAGDNIQKMGIPTLLFEGGHSDYTRQETRKYFALALISAFAPYDKAYSVEDYFAIPNNVENHYDVIFRNVKLKESLVDIGIMYEESVNKDYSDILLKSSIVEIGDLSFKIGHQEYDAEGREYSSNQNEFPKLGSLADFTLNEWVVDNGKLLSLYA